MVIPGLYCFERSSGQIRPFYGQIKAAVQKDYENEKSPNYD